MFGFARWDMLEIVCGFCDSASRSGGSCEWGTGKEKELTHVFLPAEQHVYPTSATADLQQKDLQTACLFKSMKYGPINSNKCFDVLTDSDVFNINL